MGTVEKEQDVIKIFLVDGTCKGFLVTSTMTVNALKFLVAQKTNVDKTDWNNFGVFMATREKIVGPLVDRPYDVHKKWGRHSGFDLRFVFKRIDEPYPAEPEPEEEPTATIPAAGTETPNATADTTYGSTPPQSMKTTFGSPSAGSTSIFHKKITSTPPMSKAIDPTVSYNTAQLALQVQSDPEQQDLGYDYNLEMNTPEYDLTYMNPGAANDDVYGNIGTGEVPLTGSNEAIYSGFEEQGNMFPTELVDAPSQPRPEVTQSQPQGVVHPGVSRTTSVQVKVPNETAPKPPQRAQSTQVIQDTTKTPPRVGNTVPKRPPPPSSLRKSGKVGVRMINANTTSDTASPPKTPSSPKTAPRVQPNANPKVGSPKSGSFKMPPPVATRPVSMQVGTPPKAIPKTVVGATNSPSGSPPTQRRFLYKTEDAAKSRHEQHKQIVVSWINSQLACRGISIRNLTTDIQDGVALIKLLEVLSEKKLEKYYGIPKMMMQKLDNLGHFLSFLRVLGIRIDGVSAEDLYVGNENLALAILLVVLRKYGAAVPKPARRPSSVRAGGSPRRPSTSSNNPEPVRKTSRSGSNSNNTAAPTAGSPKRKTSNASNTATSTPVRKSSKVGGSNSSPSFTMPPPARTKSGMPKTAPKRPGTPQLPRKTSDKVMPNKPAPLPPTAAAVAQTKEENPVEVSRQVDPPEEPKHVEPVVERAPEAVAETPVERTVRADSTKLEDVVKNLNSAVSDVDKILEELNLGGSISYLVESPKMPEESPTDYNNEDYSQYMESFSSKFEATMTPDTSYDESIFCAQPAESPESPDNRNNSLSATPETKFSIGSFIRSSPQGIASDKSGSGTNSPILSPRVSSPRTTLIGQRGSVTLTASPTESSPAIAIPSKPKLISEQAAVGSPGRFRNSPKPGTTKLPPHKMLMMHSQTSKYMAHNRGSSNYDSLKAASSPSLGGSPNSNNSSPVTSPTSHRKSSIIDESGNVYTEVIKLDDLSADPKGEVDPRYELDLTVNAGSKQKNSAFRDPNKTVLDLNEEIEDIDSLLENVMMTIGPSNNNNADINWD